MNYPIIREHVTSLHSFIMDPLISILGFVTFEFIAKIILLLLLFLLLHLFLFCIGKRIVILVWVQLDIYSLYYDINKYDVCIVFLHSRPLLLVLSQILGCQEV